MLEHYFESEARMRQHRRGPLAEHLDGIAAQFQRDSYARSTRPLPAAQRDPHPPRNLNVMWRRGDRLPLFSRHCTSAAT